MATMTTQRFDLPEGKRWEVRLAKLPNLGARLTLGMNDRHSGQTVGVKFERADQDRRTIFVYSASGIPLAGTLSVTYPVTADQET